MLLPPPALIKINGKIKISAPAGSFGHLSEIAQLNHLKSQARPPIRFALIEKQEVFNCIHPLSMCYFTSLE